MPRQSKKIRALQTTQLDQRLAKIRNVLPELQPPRTGWLATLRQSLGIPQKQLATRLGMTRQALAQLEVREAEGTATLNALAKAAEALGASFVWAIVPEKAISKTLEDRAYELAKEMIAAVQHTMRLEDQETDSDTERRIRELAEDLITTPRRLWSTPGDV